MDFQSEKARVQALYSSLEGTPPERVAQAIAPHVAPDWHWRAVHPWHEAHGAESVARAFWEPFLAAMRHVQRREDVFFAGLNEEDGFASPWVVSMGHLLALFDRPFLGIQATGRLVMLRYAEFHRIEAGRIAETAFFCDLIHLMQQAGLSPLPAQTGAALVQPGPRTHDGLLRGPSPPEEGARTLALINRMRGAIEAQARFASPEEELAATWAPDMLWWGPGGIGATYTIPRYVAQHQQPFRRGMSERRFNGHVARLAEGHYGGFFGWPNLTLTLTGGLMGLPATGGQADMRVVDIYRREGAHLAENWVFIDMPHFLAQQGLDVLGRMAALSPPGGGGPA